MLERYTVLLYDRTSNEMTVSKARKQLFSKKGHRMDDLPPTQAALLQHTKRADFQGTLLAFIFRSQPKAALFFRLGMGENQSLTVMETGSHCGAHYCPELLKCGCNKGCKSGANARRLCYCEFVMESAVPIRCHL